MQFSKKPEFVYHPDWYKDIEYLQDLLNEDTYQEDSIRTGIF